MCKVCKAVRENPSGGKWGKRSWKTRERFGSRQAFMLLAKWEDEEYERGSKTILQFSNPGGHMFEVKCRLKGLQLNSKAHYGVKRDLRVSFLTSEVSLFFLFLLLYTVQTLTKQILLLPLLLLQRSWTLSVSCFLWFVSDRIWSQMEFYSTATLWPLLKPEAFYCS